MLHYAARLKKRSPDFFLELPSLLRDLVFRICGLAMTMLGIVPIYNVFNCLSPSSENRARNFSTGPQNFTYKTKYLSYKIQARLSPHWHLLPRLLFSVFFFLSCLRL